MMDMEMNAGLDSDGVIRIMDADKSKKSNGPDNQDVVIKTEFSQSVTNIARSVARLGDDDGEKSHAEDVTDILLACNDAFQDEGSESSEPASEGSSASSTFCDLEKNYSKVLQEMKTNEALAPFINEYTKLYESLYEAHRSEKDLMEKYNALRERAFLSEQKVFELTNRISLNYEEIEKLKQDVINTMKRADAAHTREQNAQDTIENLRVNVQKLHQEIAQKNRQLAASEDTSFAKQKESLIEEKEKLMGEVDTLKQRLKNMALYTEELEKRSSVAGNQIAEMQENMDMQLSEISKERRARQRAEDEVLQLQEELAVKTSDLQTANESINAAAANVIKLESSLKEQRISTEKMQREINKLSVKKLNLETDLENANNQIDSLEKEMTEKEKYIKDSRVTMNRMRDEMSKCKTERELTTKRLQKLELERSSLEQQLKEMSTKARTAEHEAVAFRKQLADKMQETDIIMREKTILARTKETLGDQIKRLNQEVLVCEFSRRKVEHELDSSLRNIMEIETQLAVVEKERDKHSTTAQHLAQQMEEYISKVKLKQLEISSYKKRLAETEAKHRQQQNLFELLRAERNACSKSLTEAHDEIQELKNKLKVLSNQIEQLKEDIVTKEGQLVKEQFIHKKLEKEREALKVELQSSRKEASDLKREIESMRQEEKSLRQMIQRAESDIGRHRKDIENVMNERDMLGTQLVRRNDELSLQYSRIKVLHGTLQRGQVQYNERLDDIRLLKLEVKKLRTEKALLIKNIQNMSDLRNEVFHLNHDLTRERLKVMALEEEVQTPLNIHRWRKLEGSDPNTYELLKKIQILQKRIIKMAADMIEKEKKIKDTEKLYMNLREILSKHPGPEVAISLNKTQKALRERGRKVKCLLAQLSTCEVQMGEYKIDMDKMSIEMTDLKKKYFVQKKKLQISKETKPKSLSETVFPIVGRDRKKFHGGGFNMVTPTPRNCFVVDSTCR
ncbi:cilia- and flagella-associated protein 58-like [Frieseomelitta varia]|uniref:cilia- and flagella-associated protein 58-like n=1 Tax=Frieseomelitta varia TaxID=561572 RepID=UPI001CB694A1|nr:cilia- and flagella-associated protein 58-like [Frieseomelitta varia]